MPTGELPGWSNMAEDAAKKAELKLPEVEAIPTGEPPRLAADEQPRPAKPAARASVRGMQQNIGLAVAGGLLGASAGGAAFGSLSGVMTVKTGLLADVAAAAAVGACTGICLRIMGRVQRPWIGAVGAAFALLGALWGRLFDWAANYAAYWGTSFAEELAKVFSDPFRYMFGGNRLLLVASCILAPVIGFFTSFPLPRRRA